MLRYFIRRLLMLIPVILAVSFIVYSLMNVFSGDVISRYNTENFTMEEVEALRHELHLDEPMIFRYGRYMYGMLRGDLGTSDITGYAVWDSFMSRLPNTLLLAGCAFIIGVTLAIPMGVLAARHAGKLTDNLTTTVMMIGMSMPGFWLGMLLILLFSYKLAWLPTGGMRDGVYSIILPAIAASVSLIATTTRQTRSSMLEVLRADYLRTARAKGVPERVVIRKHALGNALIPIVTSLGIALSSSLAGSAVVETVFAWPGIGRFVVEAVNTRDIKATTGAVILTSIIYCLVQLGVDLVYAMIDPRIKAQYVSAGKAKKRLFTSASNSTSNSEAAPQARPEERLSDAGVAEIIPDEIISEPDESAGQKDAFPGPEALSLPPQTEVSHIEAGIDDVAADTGETRSEDTETAADSDTPVSVRYRKRSQLSEVFRHLTRNPGAAAGLTIVAAMVLLFIVSLFVPFEAATVGSVKDRFTPPGARFFFGTDGMGRDLFMRVVYAARFSLPIGFGATLLAAVVGVMLGAHAAYYGGVVDDIIMRFSDIFASIPGLLLGMIIVSALGRSLTNLIIAVGLSSITIFIRISRASVLSVKDNEFVEAARAVGLSDFRIIFTQVLPNGLAPIMISFSIALGIAILVSASLSFLGLGIPVPNPEWGSLVSAGRDNIRNAPWLTTFPGLFIMMTVMGFNLLGDGLRDALDPKLKK